MKKSLLTFFILIMAITMYCQTKETFSKLNFGFEVVEKSGPAGWVNYGSSNYILTLDSTNVKGGKYAVSIEFKEGSPEFKAWAFTIPDNYAGKKITLTGYIKTENVTDGYAGLWMRIDPSIAFDNMYQRGVTGTSNWTKYEITLDMNPEKTKQIVIGGLLVGKGKMWLDDLEVSIDGRLIKDLKPFNRKIFPAEKDKEFDKGSGISNISVNKNQIENLNALGLIWGFLKYYHPNIARGEYNWDYELFRVLPKVLKSANGKSRDEILIKWIDGFGKYSEQMEAKAKSTKIKLEPNLSWIKNSGFSDELTSLLVKIQNANRPTENYYIGLQPGIGNPDFKNENDYLSMKYPDAGFRVLALYRYWNMINYFFPYKNLIDKDWNSTLKEYIPVFLNAKDELEYELAAIQIIGDVQDTHANLWGGADKIDAWKGINYPPVHVRFIENKLVVTDYYDAKLKSKVGLEIGDIITKINGKAVEDIVKEKSKYYPASNMPTRLRDISADIMRSNATKIEISFVKENAQEQSKTLQLYPRDSLNIYHWYKPNDNKCYKMLDNNIGYITLQSIKEVDIPKIKEEFRGTKGIIIDIRNYPSTFVPFSLGSFFVNKATPFVKFTNGDIENPGEFTFDVELEIPSEGETYKGKLIVLVNELSQSQAEYTAMAFRAGINTTIIGSTTAGADGNVSAILLPGGMNTMISGIGVYYPDGKETQRIGIVPDIECKPTIQGIREGRDELMEKAIKVINKQ